MMNEVDDSKKNKLKVFLESLSLASLGLFNIFLTLVYLTLLLVSFYLAIKIFLIGIIETNIGLIFCSVIPILIMIVFTYLFGKHIKWFYKWAMNKIQ